MVVARGHTFLHIPGPTTNNTGAIGISIFQNNNIPVEGEKNKQLKMTAPSNQKANCTIRQVKIDRKEYRPEGGKSMQL
jgi:putative alpha-1,2-mannosidase